LGRRLGLKTVAEWVQDEASAAMLAEWGCDYLQGALVGLASAERPWEAAGVAQDATQDITLDTKQEITRDIGQAQRA
jgi:EAL domain-containing protein (putative c-di-GMP-specific phosphodiesterase class I)